MTQRYWLIQAVRMLLRAQLRRSCIGRQLLARHYGKPAPYAPGPSHGNELQRRPYVSIRAPRGLSANQKVATPTSAEREIRPEADSPEAETSP